MWQDFDLLPLNCIWLDPNELIQRILTLFEEEDAFGWHFTQGHFPLDSVFSSAPPKGGAHPGRLLVWHPMPLAFGGSVLLANYRDGMIQLMRRLNRRFNIRYFHAVLARDHLKLGRCAFAHSFESGEQRVVQVLKDPRWEFFADGKPLLFEELASYRNADIKLRLRPVLVVKYLKELGWDLDSEAFWEVPAGSWKGTQSFTRQE